MITKIIYETLNADFNNMHFVITKIICIDNQLGFYVGLTLFWALYLSYFKKDPHHYFKMYNVDKFFKLLSTNESANDSQDADSMFKLLLLISIYQNYVLLNKENPENHQVFQEFFRVSQHDREKLKSWLINVKNLIEANNPLGKSNQSADVLMVSLKLVALPKYMTSTETSFFMRDSIRANKIARGWEKAKKKEKFCEESEKKTHHVSVRWHLTI